MTEHRALSHAHRASSFVRCENTTARTQPARITNCAQSTSLRAACANNQLRAMHVSAHVLLLCGKEKRGRGWRGRRSPPPWTRTPFGGRFRKSPCQVHRACARRARRGSARARRATPGAGVAGLLGGCLAAEPLAAPVIGSISVDLKRGGWQRTLLLRRVCSERL